MPRYVILLHEISRNQTLGGARGTHYDLMLEHNGVLRTWAISDEPAGDRRCLAEQLSDHRIDYLDYEGPVSGNRGNVTRWEVGRYRLVSESDNRLEIQLEGSNGRRDVTLSRDDNSHFWMVSFSLAPIRGSSSSSSS